MSRLASLKALTIPLLAAGAAVAVFSLLAARRDVLAARATYSGKLDQKNKATLARAVEKQERAALSRPRRPVLPIAFWDIAELDGDEQRPTSSEGYAAIDSDLRGARWLARATQSVDEQEFDDYDDPAEVAADSMSMISEASRTAAGRDPTDDDAASEREPA